ncbi:MAG: HAD hydrolase-like protein [Lachnospiraceae bacterium]|nr:HAD hydrolase-like protein [Lachnospiraceae bacterium]
MNTETYKKYILFDLDGTLTDPKVGICTSVQYALKSFGIDEPDIDVLEPFIGPPLIDSFMEFYGFSEEDAKKAVEKYRERFSTVGLFENKVYKGIAHMLKRLKRNGFHLAVASSKPTVFVEKILEHFHLRKYFEVVVGSNLDGTRTDKNEVIDEALRQLFKGNRINKDLIYMVGDRKFDVLGAKKQNIESVAVLYGYGDYEELSEAHADYIVFTPAELEEFLMRQTPEYSEGRVCKKKGAGAVPISFTTVLTVIGCFILFMALRLIFEVAFTAVFGFFNPLLPGTLREFLLKGSEPNPGSAFYIGNAGTIISGLAYLAASIPVFFVAKRYIQKTARDMYLLHPMNPSALQIILGVVFVIAFTLATQIAAVLTQAAASSDTYAAVASAQYSCSIPVGIVVYCIIAPLAEELLFRGVIYTAIRRYTPIFVAIIASGVIFGIYHGNIVQGIYAFIFGCLMAIGYEYYGVFFAAVIMHALQNLISYLGTYIFLNNSFIVSWPFVGIMAAVSIGAAVMLFIQKRGNH